MADATGAPAQATTGTSTRSSSGSTGAPITSGVPWTRTARCRDILVQSRRDKKAAKRFFRKAQRFLSAFGQITSHFRPGRHMYSAGGYREVMRLRFASWAEVSCVRAAA